LTSLARVADETLGVSGKLLPRLLSDRHVSEALETKVVVEMAQVVTIR